MKELELKYGCNPNQKPSKIFINSGNLPIEILNGKPGYINLLDALNGYQLVRELKKATTLPSAASFKHVSPSGVAVGLPLDDTLRRMYFCDNGNLSSLANAYIRARGTDRVCSYGDWVALSDTCDEDTASVLANEVSDGIIAPGFTKKALTILKAKRKGNYTVIEIDPDYEPNIMEHKDVFGITFEQRRNDIKINKDLLSNIVTENRNLPDSAKRDLIIALITLKYTQSNSVCYVKDGQTIGVGAGQQSRIHCTKLAGNKADNWYLRKHPKVMNLPFKSGISILNRDNAIDTYISGDLSDFHAEGRWQELYFELPSELSDTERKEWLSGLSDVSLGSDAFFPFSDNIKRAAKSGVKYIAQPGGSIRDFDVINSCNDYNIVMVFTSIRLFHH